MTQELTAESFPRRTRDCQNGFSLVEALIVVVIGMIATAFAIPMVQSAVRSYTLNSTATNMTRMLQLARYTAVNRASNAGTVFAGNQYGVDTNCNGSLDANEVRMAMPTGVSPATTAPSVLTGLPSPNTTVNWSNFAIIFNSRGSKISACGTTTGSASINVIYVTGWGNTAAAVTVTGTGRVRSWRYTGATWR